jgi:hypothetical protein
MLFPILRSLSYLNNGKSLLQVLLAGIGIVFMSVPAQAAEQVILKYSVLRESIPVADLSNLAYKGEVSSSLENYLEMANKKPEDLRQVLNEEVDVKAVTLSKMLNSYPGEFLLDRAGEIVHTPSQRASRESLRGALVTSAVEDDKIKLIEVLENYPTSEVHVEGDRLVELYNTLDGVVAKLSEIEGVFDKL